MVAERRADASTDPPVIVIDEIQKLPQLLDEVHDLIETERIHFVLSGSSGRKLKGSGVNLLGGRAWQANLFPLTFAEIPECRPRHGTSFMAASRRCTGRSTRRRNSTLT